MYAGTGIKFVGRVPMVLPGPLRYHAMHDLESLWWIAVWFITHRIVAEPDLDPNAEGIVAQRIFASQLFEEATSKHCAMTIETWFAVRIRCLHPSLDFVRHSLEQARGHLVDAYCRAEEDFDPIHTDAVDCLYGELQACFTYV